MILSTMNFYLAKEGGGGGGGEGGGGGGSKEREGEIRGSPTPAVTLKVISNGIFKIPVERF